MAAAGAPAPPKEFASYGGAAASAPAGTSPAPSHRRPSRPPRAEACAALVLTFEAMEAARGELEEKITEAGDDVQKKMKNVIPLLQQILGEPLVKHGFPPPPVGATPGPRPASSAPLPLRGADRRPRAGCTRLAAAWHQRAPADTSQLACAPQPEPEP